MLRINEEQLNEFLHTLALEERSKATMEKYLHDVQLLRKLVGEEITDKNQLIGFKDALIQKGYAVSSINSMLAAVNHFLIFAGLANWKLRFLKVQHTTFSAKEKELSRMEYESMVRAAEACKNARLSLLVQTICSTGIRVSELRGITVDALHKGCGQIISKGKVRQILIPAELCRKLLAYCRERHIKVGPVFITRGGKPMDRSNIWKMLKKLGDRARVKAKKVFPHNLRHLFARCFYRQQHDLDHLAAILGHSNINTTRIYTKTTGEEHRTQVEQLKLVI